MSLNVMNPTAIVKLYRLNTRVYFHEFYHSAVVNPLQRPSPLQEDEGRAGARLKF